MPVPASAVIACAVAAYLTFLAAMWAFPPPPPAPQETPPPALHPCKSVGQFVCPSPQATPGIEMFRRRSRRQREGPFGMLAIATVRDLFTEWADLPVTPPHASIVEEVELEYDATATCVDITYRAHREQPENSTTLALRGSMCIADGRLSGRVAAMLAESGVLDDSAVLVHDIPLLAREVPDYWRHNHDYLLAAFLDHTTPDEVDIMVREAYTVKVPSTEELALTVEYRGWFRSQTAADCEWISHARVTNTGAAAYDVERTKVDGNMEQWCDTLRS